MMGSQLATQIFGFGTSIVIARLLSPRQVGLAAEAAVFGSLALVIADFGIAAAIVQRPELSEEDKSTAFWASLLLGAGLTAIGVGLSWPIALLYGQPQVQGLFAVLSFSFLLTAPGIVQGALLTRELSFRPLEVRTIVATAAGCATSIILAALGFGPWAIVAQWLATAGVSSVLLWRSSAWRPRWSVSRTSLRGMAGFASNTFGARSLSWGVLNADNLLVGRFLGAAPLGAYSLACSVALSPLNRVAVPITQVFFPAFSRMQDPREIGAAWLRALRMVALVAVPSMLGVIVVSRELVQALFGARWMAAAPALQLLAPIGLMQALTALNSGILQSMDRSRTLFRSTMLVSVVSIIAFAAGLPWGIKGVAFAYLVASCLVQPRFTAITARTVGLTLHDCLVSIRGVLEAGAGMLLLVLGARAVLIAAEVGSVARLIVLVAWGAATYFGLIAWRAPEVRAEFEQMRSRRSGAGLTGGGPATAAEPEPDLT
jgi:O-antigen/teichoic acid export membrane protein